MKVGKTWLDGYFDTPLPQAEKLADALTFHVAEVEEVTPDYLDVKVLPDRACYLLSHRGVAYELSATLGKPMQGDPLREPVPEFPQTEEVTATIEDLELCARYMAALVRGVKVGPSPDWLREALESVGQRSINNVVDATNYVMLSLGQPLHAFDAGKLSFDNGTYAIGVRGSSAEERITTLDKIERTLPEGTLVIEDAHKKQVLAIAGVKGGTAAEVDAHTTDLIIESANFDGTTVRRAAQALKLFTDASLRFQNRPSPILAAYGMRDVLRLITDIAGGELVGVADAYPMPVETTPVVASLAFINGHLGSSFSQEEVTDVFDRLGFTHTLAEDTFTVLPPFERRDIAIPEDLAEEVARIEGYDRIPSTELPNATVESAGSAKFQGIERVKDFLVERGYLEISSPSFDVSGDIELANPLQQDKPWLRASLLPNMKDALTRARLNAPRALGPTELVRLFELGTVFTKDGEMLVVALGIDGKGGADLLKENVATLEQELLQTAGHEHFSLDATMVEVPLTDEALIRLGENYTPAVPTLGAYEAISSYPFALRDIAVWTPSGTIAEAVASAIRETAGDLLVRLDLFDTFEKDGRISYAYRLVFESLERTLSDQDLDPVMAKVTAALGNTPGFTVR